METAEHLPIDYCLLRASASRSVSWADFLATIILPTLSDLPIKIDDFTAHDADANIVVPTLLKFLSRHPITHLRCYGLPDPRGIKQHKAVLP
jgi:hypothetical protein